MLIRQIAFVLMVSSALLGQRAAVQPENGNQAASAVNGAQTQSETPPASGQRSPMLDDLNRMESLNMNMSSEIEFLHDQNLQILLRTNAQMWTILIRDLRRQIEQEDQRRATPPQAQAPAAKPNSR